MGLKVARRWSSRSGTGTSIDLVALAGAIVGDGRRQVGLATAMAPLSTSQPSGLLGELAGHLEGLLQAAQVLGRQPFVLAQAERAEGLLGV